MAPRKGGGKDFSQLGYIDVTESAANTLTFQGLSVFSNVLGQKGMVIHRVEYSLSNAQLAKLVAAGDIITFGLAGTDTLTTVDLSNSEVYDYNMITSLTFGTPANMVIHEVPWVKDFSNLPGGGILVPADRLYAYVRGSSLASAVNMAVRFWFDIIDLNAQDYLELAQAMRVLK